MAIFSAIRKSRQHAKDEDARIAELKKKEDEKAPYRHVPTHAAIDAFASAPPSWREAADRARIVEQNQRRSAMMANASQLSLPTNTVPRVGSGLSQVSFPGGPMSPKARVPRSYSYAGVSPYRDGSRDIIYSIPDDAHANSPASKEHWPAESTTSDSTSSQDELEMGNTRKAAVSNTGTKERPHRLHPAGRGYRVSDTSLDRRIVPNYTTQSINGQTTPSRSSRPPVSMRDSSHTRAVSPNMLASTPDALSAEEPSANVSRPKDSTMHNTSSSEEQGQEAARPVQTSVPSSPLALSSSVSEAEAATGAEEHPVPDGSCTSPHPGTPVHEASPASKNKTEEEVQPPKPISGSRPQRSPDATPWEDSADAKSMAEAESALPVAATGAAEREASTSENTKDNSKKSSKSGGRLLKKNRH